MKKFKEHDSRKKADLLAEFITPNVLREFIANKINGDNLKELPCPKDWLTSFIENLTS